MSTSTRNLAACLLLAAVVAGCGGAAATPAATAAATTPAASAGDSVALTSPAATSVATKVSASSASHEELVAALTSAGVSNADRWAREVEEYRPYDASDTSLQKLQDNLSKYNPDAATLAAILSALEP